MPKLGQKADCELDAVRHISKASADDVAARRSHDQLAQRPAVKSLAALQLKDNQRVYRLGPRSHWPSRWVVRVPAELDGRRA